MAIIIEEKQDLTYLSWSRLRHSSGTAGSFLKSYETVNDRKIYYKLSDFNVVNGIIGHECVNEIIVDRLLQILNIEHLSYRLIHADVMIDGRVYETYLNASDDFKKRGESKTAFEDFFQLERCPDETLIDFCKRYGWEQKIYEMLIVDFLILNRDRHGANIEVLRNPQKRSTHLAPLFDHGLSFVCRCQNTSDLQNFDGGADIKVQSFFGSNSAYENMRTVPVDAMRRLPRLKMGDRKILFEGLEKALPEPYFDVIWDMLWERWMQFEAIRNP